jgi:hypothetical protein
VERLFQDILKLFQEITYHMAALKAPRDRYYRSWRAMRKPYLTQFGQRPAGLPEVADYFHHAPQK